jgi:hypothetical protein
MEYREDDVEQREALLIDFPKSVNVEVSNQKTVRLLASPIYGLQGKDIDLRGSEHACRSAA